MSSDDQVRPTSEPAMIRTPDQVQQARRPDVSAPVDVDDRRSEAAKRDAGILGQLETERAHD